MSAEVIAKRIRGAVIALTFCVATPAFCATIPIVNGGFETAPNGNAPGTTNGLRFNQLNSTGAGWDTYNTLSGWTKTVGGGRVEVQSDFSSAIDAHGGDYFISLDGGPGRNAGISQNVTLAAGSYFLSFWFSPESALTPTNSISYNLGTLVSGQASVGTNGAQVGTWVNIRQQFTVLTGASYSLQFAALNTADGIGGFIDDVSIVTAVPLPAGGAALISGIAALAMLRRRRRAA